MKRLPTFNIRCMRLCLWAFPLTPFVGPLAFPCEHLLSVHWPFRVSLRTDYV
ncbi:hypothetical protein POPTR_010G128801v4 [Populus trichocarpa]|uniref:Uncharacterized protein n=1 Tax=Populus trichocarpa TaxID=3694 RepID=A0ACC0SD67_POPTR|nr:hypothetical protein BDE02_10G114600 [Populus trichocarpa]KAI9387155.1 hypothetical protein POPTR_010G128801v4 [Populus trichocarpa]